MANAATCGTACQQSTCCMTDHTHPNCAGYTDTGADTTPPYQPITCAASRFATVSGGGASASMPRATPSPSRLLCNRHPFRWTHARTSPARARPSRAAPLPRPNRCPTPPWASALPWGARERPAGLGCRRSTIGSAS
jgi:hypothetical protein